MAALAHPQPYIRPAGSPAPMGEMNTTPLIDVLLVLLVMFIITIPPVTHALQVDLPRPGPAGSVHPIRNTLSLDPAGQALWNGQPLSDDAVRARLAAVAALSPEPEVQFRPQAQASYARSAELLRLVRESGVTRFGIAGAEEYRTFGRP